MPEIRAAVIDYEAGNLRSIARALIVAGADPILISTPVDDAFDLIVLPGVGAFGAAVRRLTESGVAGWIHAQVASGTLLVGVCLGMQLLYEDSEESRDVPGLRLLHGHVRRLPRELKVPHTGWNQLLIRSAVPLVEGVPMGAYAYFVHSYVVEPANANDILAVTSYGVEFPSIVQRGRILGLQFHPEKSGDVGLRLLHNVIAFAAAARGAPV